MSDPGTLDTADPAAAPPGPGPEPSAPAPAAPGGLWGEALKTVQPPPSIASDRSAPDAGDDLPPMLGGMWGEALKGLRPPERQPNYEPYMPAARRQPSDWGKDDHILEGARKFPRMSPGPFMPQARDIRTLLQQVLGGLGRVGSPNIAALAMSGMRLNGKFIKDFIAGREAGMKLVDAQYKRNMADLDDKQRQESQDYAEVFALYGSDWNRLKPALEAVAAKYNDDKMRAAIATGDPRVPERLQSTRDQYWLSGSKMRSQTDKQAKEEEARQAEDDFLTPKKPLTPRTPGAAPGATGATEAPATGLPEVSDEVSHAGQALQMGDTKGGQGMPTGVPRGTRAERAVINYKNALDAYMTKVLNDPRITGDQVDAAVRAANPAMADLVKGILSGGITPTASESGKDPAIRMAENLATKINPNHTRDAPLREGQRKIAEERSKLSTYRGDIDRMRKDLSGLRRIIPRNVADMDYLIGLAEKTNKSGVPVLQRWINAGKKDILGDEDVTKFNTQLKEFQRDAGAILTTLGGAGSGVYTVYAQRNMAEFVDGGQTPGQFRAMGEVLKRDYENLLVPTISELNRIQEQAYGTGNYKPESADDILALLRGGRALPPMPTFRKVD